MTAASNPVAGSKDGGERAAVRSARPARQWLGGLMAAPPLLVVALFVGIPVVSGVLYTLGHFGGLNSTVAILGLHQHRGDHWWGTLGAYREVLGNHAFQQSLRTTVEVALLSVALVFTLALSIALYARLAANRTARAVTALAVTPLFLPAVIGSYAILEFYAGDGFVRTVAHAFGWYSAPRLSYTIWAVVIGQVWTNLPFAVLMMTSGLAAVPDALIEAARDSGARLRHIVRHILLPMASGPAVIVASFTTISVLGSFTVPYLTGPTAPNMLGVQLTNTFQAYNRPQQSLVMAVVIFALASMIGAVYIRSNVRQARHSAAAR